MAHDISVIIPVRNEEKTISHLVNELVSSMKNLQLHYEIIFVTDENDDNTWNILKQEQKINQYIHLIKLTRAKGQHTAIIAGLNYCSGDCALIMDGDLEMPPREISKLYSEYKNGIDIIYGTNKNKNHSIFADASSRLFNYLMRKISDESIDFNTDMFRIISRRTIDSLLSFNEIEPNIIYLISLINFPSKAVSVNFEKRKYGITNYGFFRKLKLAINSILSFSTKPINTISFIGLIISLISFGYLSVILVEKIFISNYSGFGLGTLAVMISFFSGIQLFSIGIIGAYISRNFIQNKRRPPYVVEEIISNNEK